MIQYFTDHFPEFLPSDALPPHWYDTSLRFITKPAVITNTMINPGQAERNMPVIHHCFFLYYS